MIEYLRTGDRERFASLSVEHIVPSLEAYKRAHGGWSARTTDLSLDPGRMAS